MPLRSSEATEAVWGHWGHLRPKVRICKSKLSSKYKNILEQKFKVWHSVYVLSWAMYIKVGLRELEAAWWAPLGGIYCCPTRVGSSNGDARLRCLEFKLPVYNSSLYSNAKKRFSSTMETTVCTLSTARWVRLEPSWLCTTQFFGHRIEGFVYNFSFDTRISLKENQVAILAFQSICILMASN